MGALSPPLPGQLLGQRLPACLADVELEVLDLLLEALCRHSAQVTTHHDVDSLHWRIYRTNLVRSMMSKFRTMTDLLSTVAHEGEQNAALRTSATQPWLGRAVRRRESVQLSSKARLNVEFGQPVEFRALAAR